MSVYPVIADIVDHRLKIMLCFLYYKVTTFPFTISESLVGTYF